MSEGASGDAALVLFSGGQDSTTCLAWALARYAQVETVGFDYGQRHAVELECRGRGARCAARTLPALGSAARRRPPCSTARARPALRHRADPRRARSRMGANGLPNTFVPGRNLLFFTFAAAIAYRRGISVLVGGMCETDYSGYPDCRDDTLKAMQVALRSAWTALRRSRRR